MPVLEGDVLGFFNDNATSLVVGRVGVGSCEYLQLSVMQLMSRFKL